MTLKDFQFKPQGLHSSCGKLKFITCYVLLMTICNSSFPCVFRCQRLPPCKARENTRHEIKPSHLKSKFCRVSYFYYLCPVTFKIE